MPSRRALLPLLVRALVAPLLSVLALGAAGAAGAAGASAASFERNFAPVRQYKPLQCPAPTLAECKSPAYRRTACGKLEMARARVDPEATCNLLFLEVADHASLSLPAVQVVMPEQVYGLHGASAPTSHASEDCAPGKVTRTCARVQPVSYLNMAASGGTTLAFTDTLRASAFLPPSNTTSSASIYKLVTALQKSHWMTTPAGEPFRVRTCNEYVFEKYFDYRHFEDVAAVRAFDARAVYDTAFGPLDNRASIGTRSMAGIGLAQFDGTPFDTQIAFPADQPKNAFYFLPLADDTPRQPGQGMPSFLSPCAGRSHVYIDEIWLEDRDLYDLASQRPRHDESFAWHKEQNDFLIESGYSDEELYAFDVLKEELRAALEERTVLIAAFRDMLMHMLYAGTGSEVVELGIPTDPATDPDPWAAMSYVITAHEAGVDVMNAGEQTSIATALAPFAATPPLDAAAVDAYLNGVFAQQLCEADPLEQDFMTLISALMVNSDIRIEGVLHRAQAAGCFDADAPTPCDWSPQLFAQRVTDLYVKEREDDFGRCLEKTKGNIDKIRARTFHLGADLATPIFNSHGINCSQPQYSNGATMFWSDSPTVVEEYFDCIDAWIRANVQLLIDHQGTPFGPDGKVTVGKGASDSLTLGNDDFGASLSYEARFAVTGFDQIAAPGTELGFAPEKLSHQVTGKASATGRVFGKERELVKATMKATLDQVDVDLAVNGVDIYYDPPEQLFQGSVAPVMDERSANQTFVEAKAVVPVMGIPVTVRGGIRGSVGLRYTAVAIEHPNPAVTLNDELVASFEPFAGVDGFASASVDLAIIEVGVKGKVSIVHLALPYRAGTHVYVPDGIVDPALDVFGEATMTLDLLSGNLRAFGEIDFGLYSESAEVPIFSWGGIRYTKSLWSDEYSVSVEPLFVFQQQGLPGGG